MASDVVTINAPLHSETERLFDDTLIGRMKRGSYLVNTARGKIVDRDAVVRALESGQLAGYAGDVWFPQPAPEDHLWRTMPYHGMTPHVSGTRSRHRRAMQRGLARSWKIISQGGSSAPNFSSLTRASLPGRVPLSLIHI